MIYSMKKLKKKYYQDRNKIFLKMIKKDFKIWQEDIKFKKVILGVYDISLI